VKEGPRLLVRADGNRRVGMGHLKRQADLALALMARGWQIALFASDSDRDALNFFAAMTGGRCRVINRKEEWLNCLGKSDICLLDVLENDDDAAWVAQLRGRYRVPLIVMTDDSLPRPCHGDAMVNPNPCELESKRRYYADHRVRACLGPDWFMAGEDFKRCRARYRFSGKVRRIGVLPGGVDEHNTVAILFERLLSRPAFRDITIEVISSPVSRFREENIRRFAGEKVRFLGRLDSVAEWLCGIDLLFSSHGNIAYEACVLGVPMVAVNQVARQNEQAEEMEKRGAVFNGGMDQCFESDQVYGFLEEVFRNPGILESQSVKKREIVDGKGTVRMADLVESFVQNSRNVVKLASEEAASRSDI